MSPTSPTTGRAVGWTAALVAAAVAVAHGLAWLPFLSDDALISLRYADRLLSGLGLTWDDHAPVEGYSDLLWVLGTAALGALGADLIDAARVLGLASVGVAAIVLARMDAGAQPADALPGAAAAALAVTTGAWGVWAVGGLEQPLLVALVLGAAWALRPVLDPDVADPRRPATAAGALLALACWTRPDPPLLVALAAIALIAVRGVSGPLLARVVGLPIAAVAGQLGFRLAVYGDWLPNPARIKLRGAGGDRLAGGLAYHADALVALWPVVVAGVVGALLAARDPRRRGLVLLLTLWTVAWVAYVARVGGDIFPGWRHHVLTVGLLAALAGTGLASLRDRARPAGLALAAVVLLVGPTATALSQRGAEALTRAAGETWEWDGITVGRLLQRAVGDRDPLLAVDPAGSVPYGWRGRALDMLGLNDRHIARHGTAAPGGWVGHDVGDGAYVASRRPDLVLLCGPRGRTRACYRSGRQLVALPAWRAYQPLVLAFPASDGSQDRARLYVRTTDGPLAPQVTDDTVAIGPWLLATGDGVLRVDDDGPMVTLRRPTTARLPIPEGPWSVTVDGDATASLGADGALTLTPAARDARVRAVHLHRPTP